MSSARNFSFETQDDHTMNSQTQERQEYKPQYYHPYHDTPSRGIISPPPRYTSTSPQPPPVTGSPSTSPRRRPIPSDSHLLGESSDTRGRPSHPEYDDVLAPPPPPHRASPTRLSREDSGFSQSHQLYSDTNPRMETLRGQSAEEGFGSVPRDIVDRNHLETGQDAMRSVPQSYSPYDRDYPREINPYRQQDTPPRLPQRSSYGSSLPLAAGAATPGNLTPTPSLGPTSSVLSGRSIPLEEYHSNSSHPAFYSNYQDSPYQNPYNPNASSANIMHQASINPNNILDDGDDGFMHDQQPSSKMVTDSNLGNAAASAGGAGALKGLFGRKAKNYTPSGTYDPVGAGSTPEKSEWLSRQTKGRRKMVWVGVGIGLVIVIAIVAGIVGGVLGTRDSDDSSGSSSGDTNNANSDTAANGDLGKDSAEIQALMNNKNLHKVFPGMDYTPWGTQYPLCHTYPPSQNNVTRDMAVLSQLTNAVRLYGTDCNQTQMVLHAIDRLELTDMKVWMGVWIDTNQTTTNRQLDQMYKILADTKDLSIFKGVIVGNEALYRAGEDKSQSEQELIDILKDVKSQFKTKSYDLPVATSDLGDNWNGQLVQVVDYVMSNIHPFFAGVTAEVASSWTWDFWQTHDVVLTQSLPDVKQIISETGWPSSGGKDCGGSDGSCASGQSGAVASVDNMNTFMETWVCQALENGTDYFWFEAFDEPWKVIYNTDTQQWEDKWGLMDPGRNLKSGLQIPDCDGKTVGS
ncbi:murein transglycosylase [Capronia epimyces CBS 606.96]|uniref:glucan endo-1,3-beta-D-glucosidase n=1 Tax=Capronia epimyces CBS 606.96 TaxID=1182542 RepID=W9YSR0_9EURO|nr:murein transglycosylase [Capronia epimyces CBS 606.96]EXJ92710.1 murein transglycosylase [Capronia epimyces CBS 606.96]